MSIFSSGHTWAVIDWGARRYEAFLLKNAALIESKTGDQGILDVEDGAFEAALKAMVDPWLATHGEFPIVLTGLVGGRQGWVEAALVRTPCQCSDIRRGIVQVATNQLKDVAIIPGILHTNSEYPEALRGEEVSIMGAKVSDGWILRPGEHTKMVRIIDNKITQLTTYITGELYQLLAQHSSLGGCAGNSYCGIEQKMSPIDFMTGVRKSLADFCLSKVLYSVTTRRLFNQIEAEHISSYLSGLLIGHELRNIKAMGLDNITLVARGSLTELYQQAFGEMSINSELVDAQQAYLTGAQLIVESAEEEQ